MAAMESSVPRMPSVIGTTQAQAHAVIHESIAGAQVTIQHIYMDKIPAGMVFRQRPPAGYEPTSGSHIELTVAAKPSSWSGESSCSRVTN
jgi:beta-lactam-binding protein with PASTA domain